jgi:hypothetical protein
MSAKYSKDAVPLRVKDIFSTKSPNLRNLLDRKRTRSYKTNNRVYNFTMTVYIAYQLTSYKELY